MKMFACFIALFLAVTVSAQLTYEELHNTCTEIPPKADVDKIMGSWEIAYSNQPVGRCGTLKFAADGQMFTGTFTQFNTSDTSNSNPEITTNYYVVDPKNRAILQRAQTPAGPAFRVMTIAGYIESQVIAVIGCDFTAGNVPENYAAVYAVKDAIQKDVDKVKAYIENISKLILNKFIRDSSCPDI